MKEDDERGPGLAEKLTYLLIGGGIGAILALLMAPKAGYELRGDIADATRKGIDRSREAAQRLGDRAGEYHGSARDYYRDKPAGAAAGPPLPDPPEAAGGGLGGHEDFPERAD